MKTFKELGELRDALSAFLQMGEQLTKKLGEARELMAMLNGEGALSDRDREILELSAEGKSAREIADELKLSPRTVELYRRNLRRMMGLSPTESFQVAAKKWLQK